MNAYLSTSLAFFFCLLLPLLGHGQFSMTKYNSKYYEAFEKSTTAIVLTGDEEIDNYMKTVIEAGWKVTPFEFISIDQIETYESKENYSILCLQTIKATFHTRLLGLYMPADINRTRGINYIAVATLRCYYIKEPTKYDECFYNDFMYKFHVMISQINQVTQWVKEMSFKPKLAHVAAGSDYALDHNKHALKTLTIEKAKPLLLSKEFFEDSKFTATDFRLNYGHKVEFVTQDKFEQLILERNMDYWYGIQAQIPNAGLYVYDPVMDKTIFYDFNFGGKKARYLNKPLAVRLTKHINRMLGIEE